MTDAAGGGVRNGEAFVDDLDTGGVEVFILYIECRFFAVVEDEVGTVREAVTFLSSSR